MSPARVGLYTLSGATRVDPCPRIGGAAGRRVFGCDNSTGHSVRAMHVKSEPRFLWECPSGATVTTANTFGGLLRQLRKRAGLSQHQIAERVGTTQSAIARLESGAAEPRLATLEKLAEALGEDLLIHVSGREIA